jgi:Transposase DDE domain group 1
MPSWLGLSPHALVGSLIDGHHDAKAVGGCQQECILELRSGVYTDYAFCSPKVHKRTEPRRLTWRPVGILLPASRLRLCRPATCGTMAKHGSRRARGVTRKGRNRFSGSCPVNGSDRIKESKRALRWARLSCRAFRDNGVRLQLFALAYNLANFLRSLVLPTRGCAVVADHAAREAGQDRCPDRAARSLRCVPAGRADRVEWPR